MYFKRKYVVLFILVVYNFILGFLDINYLGYYLFNVIYLFDFYKSYI